MDLVDPGVKAYTPVKGKANVIMFVGLQVGMSNDSRQPAETANQVLTYVAGLWQDNHLHQAGLSLPEEGLEGRSGLCRHLQVATVV